MKVNWLYFLIFANFSLLLVSPMSIANPKFLTKTEQAIIPIAALSVSPYTAELKSSINHGLNAGLTINQIKEVLVQTYPYAGFPRSLNALSLLKQTIDDRKNKGIKDEVGPASEYDTSSFKTLAELEQVGNRVRNELVGQDLTQNASDYAQIAPEIDQFLKAHLFGAIFTRKTLTHKQRELATVSMLANQEGLESQLGSHLFISHNVGWSWDALKEIATILEKTVNNVSARRMKDQLKQLEN